MTTKQKSTTRWPLGVFVSIDAGLGVTLDVARQLAIPTLHLHAPHLQSRTPAAIEETRRQLREANLTATCVFAGFVGESYASIPTVERTVGLAPPETRRQRTAELIAIAQFAQALDVPCVGVHLGFVPHNPEARSYAELIAVTREVCDAIASQGQALHLETGQEPADVLLRFLHDVARGNLFVNFDPANMILYGAGEPVGALRQLGPWVRSVHCKDALWSPEPGVAWGAETPLGAGSVDFEKFLRTLDEIGYDGPLTIERELTQDPVRQRREIGAAAALLTELKARLGGE
jgi:sugar phosphate isomerase/epimerase